MGIDNQSAVKITIDDNVFTVNYRSMAGAQIKGLVGKDSAYQLYRCGASYWLDRKIDDNEAICLTDGSEYNFYTVPRDISGG